MGLIEENEDRKITNQSEMELLERISKLELDNNRKTEIIENHNMERARLKREMKSLQNRQEEESTQKKEIFRVENQEITLLSRKLENSREELDREKRKLANLKSENLRLASDLARVESELARFKENKEGKIEELKERESRLTERVKDYETKIKRVETEGLELKNEMNKLKSRRTVYHKDYNMLQQMLKTKEVQVRSLSKEIAQIRKSVASEKKKTTSVQQAAEGLIDELRQVGVKRTRIAELMESAIDLFDLDELFDDDLSGDSLDDLALDSEMKLGIRNAGKMDQAKFESELRKLDMMDSKEFGKESGALGAIGESSAFQGFRGKGTGSGIIEESSFVYRNSIGGIDTKSRNTLQTDDPTDLENYNNYSTRRQTGESQKQHFFKKKNNSGSLRHCEKNRDEYKSQIEMELEEKIKKKTRSKRFLAKKEERRESENFSTNEPGRVSQNFKERSKSGGNVTENENQKESFFKSRSGTTDFKESLQQMKNIFLKLSESLQPDIYQDSEKKLFFSKISKAKNSKDLFSKVFHFLDRKVEKLFGDKLLLLSDQSFFFFLLLY